MVIYLYNLVNKYLYCSECDESLVDLGIKEGKEVPALGRHVSEENSVVRRAKSLVVGLVSVLESMNRELVVT